jgi:hypothetical protein
MSLGSHSLEVAKVRERSCCLLVSSAPERETEALLTEDCGSKEMHCMARREFTDKTHLV